MAAVTVLIQCLAWEPPYATGVALKQKKKKQKKNQKKIETEQGYLITRVVLLVFVVFVFIRLYFLEQF